MLKRISINKSAPNKHTRSVRERSIEEWLEKQGYVVEHNNKSILKDRELDLYLPDHNIAFEFNGVAFHWTEFNGVSSTVYPHNKDYHRNKTIDCLKCGIALYHFWDFESIESVKKQITVILRGRVISTTSVDKNPYLVFDSVLIPLYYVTKQVKGYSEGVFTKCPLIWKTTRNTVYKFYTSGFVVNKLVYADL